jgi:hypothetical protein
MANYSAKRGSSRPVEKRTPVVPTEKNHMSKPAPFSAAERSTGIEKRAYEIYMKRVSAGTPGDEVSDWLQAESEVRLQE